MQRKPLFKALTAILTSLGASAALAAPSSYTPIGTNIGYGDSSNPNSLYSALANPANNDLNVADTKGARYGLGATFQMQAETEDLEGAVDFLDDRIKPYLDSNTAGDVTDLQNETNAFLTEYDRGNFSAIGGVTVPLVVKHNTLGGGLSFDYTRQMAAKGEIIKRSNVNASYTGGNLGIDSGDAALAVHYKELNEFALGYGRTVLRQGKSHLSVGVTARYIDILSNAKAVDFSEIADDNLGNADKDTNDYIDDIDSGSSDSNITADIGVNWTAENYMVGLIGMNLTSPKFDVNDKSIGNANATFGVDDEFELEPQFRVNAQWFSADREWTLAGSVDLKEANDLNDEATQWWSTTASYATNQAWYIPDVRMGLRGNMAGSSYTYGTFGLTMGFWTVDLASTTTDFSGIADDQEDGGVMFSTGVEFDF
ncbi:MAG: conjugal transfer protein TraF [Hydrogenovibrio sp.]|uniref:conjugal transfer protein TraF n=1 Tax=Hydrogenovibrio sp. TaxID=2065821 RepID=UPI00286FBBB9|nr:conjugal transfer protein TraF [Hydrogenovibrio sp.]MDR9498215.1 conjugal transfer protein TraF [Hydrogenovibrio sp.]